MCDSPSMSWESAEDGGSVSILGSDEQKAINIAKAQFLSSKLADITRWVEDRIAASPYDRGQILQQLEQVADEVKDVYRALAGRGSQGQHGDSATITPELDTFLQEDIQEAESPLLQEYLEPEMFCSEQNSSLYDKTQCNLSGANDNYRSDISTSLSTNERLCTPSFEVGNSDFQPCTVDPTHVSRILNTDEGVSLDTSAPAQTGELPTHCRRKRPLSEPDKCKRSHFKHKLNIPKQAGYDQATRAMPKSTSGDQFRQLHKPGVASCDFPSIVIQRLCHGIASYDSIQQLKSVLLTVLQKLVASNEVLDISTGGLWRCLTVLKANDAANEIIRRLCLYHLRVRKVALTVEMGSQKKSSSGRLADRVLTRMIKEANDSDRGASLDIDRTKLQNELNASRVWYAFGQNYSVGILALIPGKHYGLSNSR
jgi:hypothetical protein